MRVAFPGPVSEGTEAVVFNAVPLLVVAAAYAAVAGAVMPPLWGERARSESLDWAVALVYPAVSAATGILGAVVLYDRHPVGGQLWASFVAIVVVGIPALVLLVRWRERALVVGGATRARDAQQRVSALDREVGALTEISPALARARDAVEACRPVVRRVAELFLSLIHISEPTRRS